MNLSPSIECFLCALCNHMHHLLHIRLHLTYRTVRYTKYSIPYHTEVHCTILNCTILHCTLPTGVQIVFQRVPVNRDNGQRWHCHLHSILRSQGQRDDMEGMYHYNCDWLPLRIVCTLLNDISRLAHFVRRKWMIFYSVITFYESQLIIASFVLCLQIEWYDIA